MVNVENMSCAGARAVVIGRILGVGRQFTSRLVYGENEFKPNYKYLAIAVKEVFKDLRLDYIEREILELQAISEKLAQSSGILPSNSVSGLHFSVSKLLDKFISDAQYLTALSESDIRLLIARKSRFIAIKNSFNFIWKYTSPLIFSILFLVTPTSNMLFFSLKTVFMLVAIGCLVKMSKKF